MATLAHIEPAVSDLGLWEATAIPAPDCPAMEGDQDADVAIVGAGVTGLSAALTLADLGMRVAVVEAGIVGGGAAGRSSGLVNAGMWIPPSQIQQTLGLMYGSRLLDVLGEAPKAVFRLIERYKIDCDPVRKGTLQCAVGAGGLKAIEERAETWRAIGADVELLDRGQTKTRTGSDFYAGALMDNRTGMLQPLSYVRGLADAALNVGARVFNKTCVSSFAQKAGRWQLKTTDGVVKCEKVLIATDTYALTNAFGLKQEFANLPYFNVATAPLSASQLAAVLPSQQAFIDTRKILSSFRLDREGRLIVGSIGTLTGWGRSIHADWAKRAIVKVFPALRGIELQYGWYGSIGITTTHMPAIHRPAQNVFAVGGYNGRGIAAGTVFGEMIGKVMAGEMNELELPVPISDVEPSKFSALREVGFEWGARCTHAMRA